MKWIRDERRPELIVSEDNFGNSKEIIVLSSDNNVYIVIYQTGIENGEKWENWYCSYHEDCIPNVIGWCDCIQDINELCESQNPESIKNTLPISDVISRLSSLQRFEITKYKSTTHKETLEYKKSEYGRFVQIEDINKLKRYLEDYS